MPEAKMVKLIYQPKKVGDKTPEPWVREFPEAQAAKMLKMGRWKAAPKDAPLTGTKK